MKYDYVGAPWDIRVNEYVRTMITSGQLRGTVGNGGFSLRSTPVMREICNSYCATSLDDEPEDVFFSKKLYISTHVIAPEAEAYEFCRELDVASQPLNGSHIALHAPGYYLRKSPGASLYYFLQSVKDVVNGSGLTGPVEDGVARSIWKAVLYNPNIMRQKKQGSK
jgi:hypothetical protein